MDAQGWCDIGYHYLISPGGVIYAGRALTHSGAHVADHNTANLGICLLGNFEEQAPPIQQLSAAIDLWAWLCWALDLEPGSIKGHCDYMPTACPGRRLYPQLPMIRRTASERLESVRPVPDTPDAIGVLVEGRRIGTGRLLDGVVYVPARVLAAALGASVIWDPATRQVELIRGSH